MELLWVDPGYSMTEKHYNSEGRELMARDRKIDGKNGRLDAPSNCALFEVPVICIYKTI